MTLTRMILGVQLTNAKDNHLRVVGDLGTPPPALTIRRRDSAPITVTCPSDTWCATLDAGDYLLTIEAPTWIAGRIDVAVDLAPGQTLPTFVYYGPLDGDPPGTAHSLATWSAATTALTIGDPKDPWPPPPPPPPLMTLHPTSTTWFTGELSAERTRIQTQSKALPADVLDRLNAERE